MYVQSIMNSFFHKQMNLLKNQPISDTYIFPTIQMGIFNIRNDENIISYLLNHLTTKSKLFISSPYLNFTKNYQKY